MSDTHRSATLPATDHHDERLAAPEWRRRQQCTRGIRLRAAPPAPIRLEQQPARDDRSRAA